MPSDPHQELRIDAPSWNHCEAIVRRFEDAWEQGSRPGLDDYLPAEAALRARVLIELVHSDLEYRLRAGEPARVEEYLQRYAELAADPTVVVDLVQRECALRKAVGAADIDDVFVRFPQLRNELGLDLQTTARCGDTPSAQPGGGTQFGSRLTQQPNTIPFAPPPPPERIGNYRVISVLGRGAMGIVYKAFDPLLKRHVAIKMVLAGKHAVADQRSRFRAEAESAARLQHPHIVRIFEVGYHEGDPYLVLEFVEGGSLSQLLANGPLAPAHAAKMIETLAHAIQHAHAHQVIHRDLKPANVLLTADGQPKVTDFGLAKQLDTEDQTRSGVILGTPAYMAPEQALGQSRAASAAVDVYALGGILYEMLTGRPALRGATQLDTLDLVRNVDPVPPSRLAGRLPRDLDTICLKCLHKDPNRRYPGAGALAEDLCRFRDGIPIKARPVGALERLAKWGRRHPAALALALTCTLATVGLLIAFAVVVQAQARAEIHRNSADLQRQNAALKEKAATQIADYLVRIFQSADALGMDAVGFHGPGDRSPQDTLRSMLKAGAALVREHLHDQPKQRAQLLYAMGCSLRNLGTWDQAEALLKESYELRKDCLGPDDQDTLLSLQSLGRLEQERGEYQAASKIYRDVLARREQLLGPDHLLVAETKFFIAWVTINQPLGKNNPQFDPSAIQDAEQLLLEVLRVRERQLPANHRDIGHTLALLAAVKTYARGQELAAIGYAARALEVFRKSEQDTLLGNVLLVFMKAERDRNAGRLAEAEAAYTKVLDLTRRHLGDDHLFVAMQLWYLAGFHARAKHDLVAAEKFAREAWERTRRLPQRSLPVGVDALLQMADMARSRDPVVAESLYREALQWADERPLGNEKNRATALERLKEFQAKKTKAP